MNCPYHNISFEKKIYEADIEIDTCPKCRGIWLDPGELEAIQKTQENDYSNIIEKGVNKDAMLYNRDRQLDEQPINCPSCSSLMEKHEHDKNSLIVIDYCPSCLGIWLDEGELEALEVYYEREHLKHPEMSRLELLMSGFARLYHRS